MSNTISNVSPTDTFSIEKYNEIQSRLYELIGVNWYGSRKIKSHNLTSATPIKIGLEDWRSLMFDTNKVYVHQWGASSSLAQVHDSSNITINSALVNNLIDNINVLYVTSATVAVNQLNANSDNATSSRNTSWNTALAHTMTYTWDSAEEAFSFFALGGYVKGNLEFTVPSSPTIDDSRWFNTLIPNANSAFDIVDNQFHLSDWTLVTTGLVKSKVLSSIDNISNPNPDNITVTYTKINDRTLKVSLELFTDPRYYSTNFGVVTEIQVPVTSTLYIYESIGDDSIGTGIRAPEFISAPISLLEDAVLVPVEKRIISVVTSTNFSGLTTSTSTARLLEIKNRGNSLVTISGITQISGAGGTLVVSPQTANIEPDSINTFTMYYQTGDIPGTYYFNNEITGNMDSGPTKLLTKLVLSPWPFGFTLSTSSVVSTVTNSTPVSFPIQVIPAPFQDISDTTIKFVLDIAGFETATPIGFTLLVGDNKNFTVTFDPKNKAPSVYTAIVGVKSNSVGLEKYVTFNIDSQMPLDGNLGSWMSARAYDNAVVGMSYDVIGGIRYLTVGIGSGAALSSVSADYAGLTVKSLGTGTTADPMFVGGVDPTYQMVVYKQLAFSYHEDSQLRNVLIWSDSSKQAIYPELTWQTRRYYFNTAVATVCYLKASVDNRGKIWINGSSLANWGADSGSTASFIEKTFTSVAGTNTIEISFYNASINDEYEEAYHHISEYENPCNIGVIINNKATGARIWDTGMVARTDTTGYQYWQEVYRIPLKSDKTEETLYLNHYCVKDVVAVSNHAEGKRWSDFFGGAVAAAGTLPRLDHAGLFKIKHDGYGNISVTTNQWTGENPLYSSFPDTDGRGGCSPANLALTIRNLRFCLYYSTLWDANLTTTNDLRRYSNLEMQPGPTTKFFTGFKRNGEVTYTTVETPSWNSNSINL